MDTAFTELANSKEEARTQEYEAEFDGNPILKKAQTFKDVVLQGHVDPHSYVGQLFSKAHRKGTADGDEYHNTMGREPKGDIRLKWAQMKFKNALEPFTHDSLAAPLVIWHGPREALNSLIFCVLCVCWGPD